MGLWYLSSVHLLINTNVLCTKFNLNPFSTFQDMTRISNHYEKWGDKSVIYKVGLWLLFTALPVTQHLSLNHFNPFCTFQDMAQTGIYYEKN